jgi:hypothetical protein
MPRPQNPDLTKNWKVCLPATLAGTVEFYLFDRLHNKPKYGARGELLTRLLSDWVMEQKDPDARARAVLAQIKPIVNNMGGVEDLLDAIRRGLEVELAPSPTVPSPVDSLA